MLDLEPSLEIRGLQQTRIGVVEVTTRYVTRERTPPIPPKMPTSSA
jgi:hypothetical protein